MTEPYRELLLGAGANHTKKIHTPAGAEWKNLTTLDLNAEHRPDFIYDLEDFPLPFEPNTFNEIHAYDVMEHVGIQGDWRFFFAQWSDFYRILKPDGVFCGISPDMHSRWAWGDPGHTRIISHESFAFLDQEQYANQVGKTPMTDYRFVYRADFRPLHLNIDKDGVFSYVLQAVKPSRIGEH